jgi:hypothetical protein
MRRAAAGLWIRPPAGGEPRRPALPRDIAEERRRGDHSGEQERDGRPQSTVVAIHVEVRHAAGETTAQVIDARIDEAESGPVYASDATDVDFDEVLDAVADAERPAFAAAAFEVRPPQLGAPPGGARARDFGRIAYVAARARTAYLSSQQLFGASAREPKLLDLRV